MSRTDRRAFLGIIGVLPMVSWLFPRSARAEDELPHVDRGNQGPVGRPEVTKEMKVRIVGLDGQAELFVGRALDFELSVRTKPQIRGRKAERADLPKFTAANIAKLPAGEFSVDSVPLSHADSQFEVKLTLDEVHLPDLAAADMMTYEKLMQEADFRGEGWPDITLSIEDGPSILLKGVSTVNRPRAAIILPPNKGQKWQRVLIVAKSAAQKPGKGEKS